MITNITSSVNHFIWDLNVYQLKQIDYINILEKSSKDYDRSYCMTVPNFVLKVFLNE